MSEQYKDTLNLPNTDFPMKANLSAREPIILKHWDKIKLYQKIQDKNKDKPKFILPDGPIYSNGAIHIGHALNRSLKDFVIKSKILSGFDAPFIPGWDCHGLPVELNVEKEVGKAGVKIDAKSFRKKCREYVLKQVDIQRDAFIRLGILGDWQNPYLTMDYQYEADTIRSLALIIQNGHLHKGYKPVHWCIDCGSALAEAEVEYQDKTSPSIYVLFEVNKDELSFFYNKIEMSGLIYVVIWTTTPWTLPANQAVAVHPEHTYSLVQVKQGGTLKNLILAEDLLTAFLEKTHIEEYKILATFLGSELENIQLKHPFYPKTVPIVLGEHVTLETGTGCVHTAPAHGQEDFIIGEKYQLPLENPVGPQGLYTTHTLIFGGEHVFKANDKVIALLKENGNLWYEEKCEHSYPHCWRHKTPLIFRATEQWFISMEQRNLRGQALFDINNVKWIPEWGQARMEGMVAGRPDWCISRQRTWLVPMSIFVHKETGDLHPQTPALMEEVAKRVEKEGIDAWHDLDIEELLGKEGLQYEKSKDALDVWFDSGVVHYCVLEKRPELGFPADLYLEGSDQHRGWFQSSLLTSVAMKAVAPYKQVLTHGFTVDAKGRKMSKSLGNVIAPDKIINSSGADILRLWVASTDYRSEMAVSEEILKRIGDIYRRIRNTARFLLANLNGFNPKQNILETHQLLVLDQWIIERASRLQQEIIEAYKTYQFHEIYQKIHNFCALDLGSFYLDIIKDRQYTGKRDGIPRRSAQTALYYIVEGLVRWMAPILSFTAEEIWQHMPGERLESVFLSEWFEFPKVKLPNQMNFHYWETLLSIRDVVNKALEEARNKGQIGSGLEAEVSLYCDNKLYVLLSSLEDELRFVLITSKADVYPMQQQPSNNAEETSMPGLSISVVASPYPKCERCWHRCEDVNKNQEFPNICGRCIENVAGVGEMRKYA